ncbi:MAG: ATP-binding protein [Fischerella sp. CENA71]|nr:ATP-binding protein [Fischerella sp. CENA71]
MNTPPRPPTTINAISYPIEFQKVLLEKSQSFVGRDFVFTAINNFVQHHNRGYFTIVGTPGSGKSAILAKYVTVNAGVVYYNAQVVVNNCAEEFLFNVCTQIIEIFRQLKILASTAQIPQTLTVETLRTMSLNALLQIASNQLEPHQRLIIAIDALDSVNRNSQPPGSNIFYLPRYLPERVYFLLTRRPFIKEKSGLLIETPSEILNLNDYIQENWEDIHSYIQQNLALKPSPLAERTTVSELLSQDIDKDRLSKSIASLTNASENNFMYISHILPTIGNDYYPNISNYVSTLSSTYEFPKPLNDYYQNLWNKVKFDNISNLALDILHILVRQTPNQENFSVENIAQTIHVDEFDIENVIENLVELLEFRKINGVSYFKLFHSSFCNWLRHKI